MARRFCAGVAATLVLCTLFACSYDGGSGDDEHDDNNFRADVIECEDALERLQRCCPDFDAKPVLCKFFYDKSSGCGSTTTSSVEPAFSRTESSCIRDTSCDALVTTEVCARAQLARAYSSTKTTGTSSSSSSGTSSSSGVWSSSTSTATENKPHAPVCP